MYFANAQFNYDHLSVPFPVITFLCIMHILNSQRAVCEGEMNKWEIKCPIK